MAPRSKKDNKRRLESLGDTSKSLKKPKVTVDSSDEDFPNDDAFEENSSISDSDELDDINSSDESTESSNKYEKANDKKQTDSQVSVGGQHTEQRKLLKERKLQRKSGVRTQQIKSLWEKLRVKNPPMPKEIRNKYSDEIWELSKDCISELVLKHDASRVVQTLIKYSCKERRDQIAEALKGKFYLLATSSYGKYLLVKLLHYGSKKTRQLIVNELHGSLRKLMRHREGAYVVEDLFVLYSTSEQKNQMIKEFWGSEYAIFKETHKDLTIEKVCETSTEKRNIISRNLIGTITAAVDKGSTGFQILHAAMREYVKIATDKEISEFIELLQDQFAELVHTQEGADVACILIAKATAKERKAIIKNLKNYTDKLINNQYGSMVFITLLMSVDDTVLVFKAFGPSIQDNLKNFLVGKYSRRPFLYMILGLDSKYFSLILRHNFDKYIELSKLTSKKPFEQRRLELLKKFTHMFLKTISENYSEILSENMGSQFVTELLINDDFYEQLEDSDKSLFQDLIDSIKNLFKGDIVEEEHPINKPFSVRLLKPLIQGGKWDNKEGVIKPLRHVKGLGSLFAQQFYEEIIDSTNLLGWINNCNSSFTIVALYECLKDVNEGKKFVDDLKSLREKINNDETNNKGAHLLLSLIK